MEKAQCILNKKKVSLLGISSLFGKVTSLLLKQSNAIKSLALYDDNDISAANEVAIINTPCKVRAFLGKEQLPCAIKNADVILIGDPCNYYCESPEVILEEGAPRIVELGKVIAHSCSTAMVLVAANPINSLLPLLSQVLTFYNAYDCNKVLGMTAVDNIRANSILARHLKYNPRKVVLPVVGGNSRDTRVPIFSQARPQVKLSKKILKRITKEIQTADSEIFCSKEEMEAIAKAYSTTRFVHSVLAALRGEQNIAEIALTRSVLLPGTNYFALPFILGPCGIEYRFPLPELSNYEEKLIAHAVVELYRDIKKGEKFFSINDMREGVNLIECQEKGLIIDKLFKQYRINKASSKKGNLEYLLMAKKPSFQMPPGPRPSKYPIPATVEEPFEHCYDGCNPLDLPALPVDKRRMPPYSNNNNNNNNLSVCCYEEAKWEIPVNEPVKCHQPGNCRFQPCNFPFVGNAPKHIDTTTSLCCTGVTNSYSQINNQPSVQYNNNTPPNECTSCEHVESTSCKQVECTNSNKAFQFVPVAAPDVDLSQLTEHSSNSENCQRGYESSTYPFQLSQDELLSKDITIPESVTSLTQNEYIIKKDDSKKAKGPKKPPSPDSPSLLSESSQEHSAKQAAKDQPKKEEEMYCRSYKGISDEIWEISSPQDKPTDGVSKKSVSVLFNKQLNGEVIKKNEKKTGEKYINKTVVDETTRECENKIDLLGKDNQLNDNSVKVLKLPSKVEEAGKRVIGESSVTKNGKLFSIKMIYKKLFKRNNKNDKLEEVDNNEKVLSLESKCSQDELTEKNREKKLLEDNQGTTENKCDVQSSELIDKLKKVSQFKKGQFRDEITNKAQHSSTYSSGPYQPYAPKCPPQYLFGEYIEHRSKEENISFDNVKENNILKYHYLNKTKNGLVEKNKVERKNELKAEEKELFQEELDSEQLKNDCKQAVQEFSNNEVAGDNSDHVKETLKSNIERKVKLSDLKKFTGIRKDISYQRRESVLPMTSPNVGDPKYNSSSAAYFRDIKSNKNTNLRTQYQQKEVKQFRGVTRSHY